jgi:hypothetical protein
VLGLAALAVAVRRWWARERPPADVRPGWPRIARWLPLAAAAIMVLALAIAIPASLGVHTFMHWRMLLARTAFVAGGLTAMAATVLVGRWWLDHLGRLRR